VIRRTDVWQRRDGSRVAVTYVDRNTGRIPGTPLYRKKTLTPALRIEGPFTVGTPEGDMFCQDGWLCWDSRGYPYPVAADEFAAIYEPVEGQQ
jgi:hypothetical protein